MTIQTITTKKGFLALSPLFVFITLYLVTSIHTKDFYKLPITVAFLIASIYSIVISRQGNLTKRIETFSAGAGQKNMLQMIWIFILAGAFAHSAKMMGSIDATVNLTLNILPGNMLLAGLFLATCFISLSIGTSVGTIVALVPIASGLSHSLHVYEPLVVALVVGGAFFGDNLSFISDTTIVATNSMHCKMKDKFKVNSLIVFPAALVILSIYIMMGSDIKSPTYIPYFNFIFVLPYLVVIVLAIIGLNVMIVLTSGIICTGILGIYFDCYDLYGWFASMGDGIVAMGELIVITMLAGGLLETIKQNGGIEFVIQKMTKKIHGKVGAELSIGCLVSMVNLCTANNTVAIITIGEIANKISKKFGVDNRKAASILDTFSCATQGLLPYGAQILMAAGLTQISPIKIVEYTYYPMAIAFMAILSIFIRYPKQYS